MKKRLFTHIVTSILLISCTKNTSNINIIPMPQNIEVANGQFMLDEQTQLCIEAQSSDSTALINQIKSSPLSFITHTSPQKAKNALIFRHIKDNTDIKSAEGYKLTVGDSNILIEASSNAGLYYGLQTLIQLYSESEQIPHLTITDEPRFEYRGMMIDVSRHFFNTDFIKKQIDAMAHYKFNHLHLHLTDAAGWRIEIKQYPELTGQAAWRTHPTWKEWWNADRHYAIEGSPDAHGGYYTQEQIRDLVAYARERFITIIPEIEMPSHSEEVLAVYPALSCSGQPYTNSDFCIGNEQTFKFLQDVLTEVMELFPSEYIHIGGDEANKQAWKECHKCKERMLNENLANVDQLQSYLIQRIESFLNAHGRKLLGWDEILDGGIAPNATVMSWRGEDGGLQAIKEGHRAIMTPGEFCYLDAYQDAPHTQPEAFGGYLPLSKVYSYDPMPGNLTADQSKLLYGVQGNLFAEYIPTEQHMEYMMYPRMLAISEIAWSVPQNKDFNNFKTRALKAIDHLQQIGYNTFDLRNEVGNRPGSDTELKHLAVGKPVQYIDGSSYYSGYTAGGDSALVDGLRGGWTYGDKRWQGFLGSNGVDVVIDLEKLTPIKSINADFMQICGPGVYMPSNITISASIDGKTYSQLINIANEVISDDAVTFKTFGWEGNTQARYIRYEAQRSHFGGFLFLDEIVIQ